MRRLLLLIAIASLAGCMSEPTQRAAGPSPPAAPPTLPAVRVAKPMGDPAASNFILYVSNQSFDRRRVDIEVTIDGDVVVPQQLFDVGNQHNWIAFAFDLPAGAHKLDADSVVGGAHLQVDLTTAARRYAVVDFWCCGEPDDPKFTFQVSDRPLTFA